MCSFGSSQASAPSSQFSTQTTTADPRAAAMYGQAFQAAQQATNRPFTPYSYDPNAFVAPLNQVQLQATQNIMGYQGASDPYYQMGAGLAGAAGTTMTPDVVGRYMSPYMSQVIDPTRQAIEQQQAAQRSSQQAEQIKAGAFGQERGQLMRAVLAGQQNLGLGQALSPLYQTGYGQALGAAQSDLQRQLQAGQVMGGLGGGYMTSGLQGAQALMGAGTLGQQTQQKGLESLYNQFLMQQAYPFQTAQYLASVAGALGPQYGSTTSGYQQSMQPLSYMGMPMSDRRLKEGVDDEKSEPEVIGKTHDGKNIYRYRLINPDTGELGPVQIGLMADEVEETNPDAIGDYNGYRTLDYERATDDAARMGGGVMGSGDYASGGGVYGGAGYVPSMSLGVGSGLQPASLSYMTPQEKKKQGLGETIKDVLGIYGAGKELYGDYQKVKDSLGLAGKSSELQDWGDVVKADGGSVEEDDKPKSYVPEMDLQSGKGLEPAKLSFMEPEQKKSTDYLGMAKDVGSLAMMAAKAIPFVASLSDPRLKTGVRPRAADGIGIKAGATDAADESEDRPDDFERAVKRTFQFEGGLNPNDVGRGPSMYGINQAAHPGIDVTKLTPEQAKQIYRKEYWEGVGADKLPPAMREMVYDTAVMAGPGRANQLLREAGTDPEAYMAAREKYLSDLLASNPNKYGSQIAKAWSARNAALRGGVGGQMTGEQPREASSPEAASVTEPRGISGFLRGKAPEGVGEKALDFMTSERFLVPLLAGIGTAASSQSRFLAPALLQGVGGGAKAYAELAQQQFEREKMGQELGLKKRGIDIEETKANVALRELQRKLAEAKLASEMFKPRTTTTAATDKADSGISAEIARAQEEASNYQTLATKATDVETQQKYFNLSQQAQKRADELMEKSPERIEKTKGAELRAKQYADLEAKIQNEGTQAQQNIDNLNATKSALSETGVYTGPGAERFLQLKQTLDAIGYPGLKEGIANTEFFRSMSNKMVTAATGGSLGVGISNADVNFLRQAQANLGTTKEGNNKIIDMAMKLEKRKQEIADLQDKYGSVDKDFQKHLRDWAKEHPLFTEEDLPPKGEAAPSGIEALKKKYPQYSDEQLRSMYETMKKGQQ